MGECGGYRGIVLRLRGWIRSRMMLSHWHFGWAGLGLSGGSRRGSGMAGRGFWIGRKGGYGGRGEGFWKTLLLWYGEQDNEKVYSVW